MLRCLPASKCNVVNGLSSYFHASEMLILVAFGRIGNNMLLPVSNCHPITAQHSHFPDPEREMYVAFENLGNVTSRNISIPYSKPLLMSIIEFVIPGGRGGIGACRC